MKKKLLAAALAAVMTLGLWGCSDEPEALVYVENVGLITDGGAIAAHDRFAGLVVSENLTEIWRDSAQSVAEIYVEQGQDVTQGALLFAYDSEAMSLEMSKLELERDRLNNTVSTLKTQISQLEAEQKKADKDKQLSYTIEIQDREVSLKEAEYNVNAKKKEIEQLRTALSNAKIYAPVAGRVVSINDSGIDTYGNPAPYITIQQSGSYRIKGTINELNLGIIAEGTPILVTSRTDQNVTWTGTVASIDFESPSQNSVTNDYVGVYDDMTSSSSYNFYVDLDNTEGLLLGQHVYLELYTEPVTTAEGLWLPEYYICQSVDGMSYVWANDDNDRLVERYVTLGVYDPNTCAWEILDGLTKEDYIAFPSEYCQTGAHTTRNPDEATAPSTEETYPQGDLGSLLPEEGYVNPTALPGADGEYTQPSTGETESSETETTESDDDQNTASDGNLR